MADAVPKTEAAAPPSPESVAPSLEQGTYEILRARLTKHGADLRERLAKLNQARQEVFGTIRTSLVATERVTTRNNCVPRDMVAVDGNRFLFGYNVQFGLRSDIQLADVFALYEHRDHHFAELPLEPLSVEQFETDFKTLYRYYRNTVFTKFSLVGPHLYMVFRTGKSLDDIKTFKWLCQDGKLTYLGNRFDHEFKYPAQHEFAWTRTHRELHRQGLHPHISIEDRLFVECIGGDLTIKVEDNTDTGEGIYAEPVEQVDQTLDDAEIFYAVVGHLVLLKIRPYQEKASRYLVYNEKIKEVRRIDAIADACVLLPDSQGIIFPSGYYLQSGEFKLFDTELKDMMFYRRIAAPNGEDILHAFHNRESGHHVLLSYNQIAHTVEVPIVCGGFSLFEDGEMALFLPSAEPQRHHSIQIWQTPYVGLSWRPEVKTGSYLGKLGNPALVRCLAECHEVLTLLGKDDTYAGLYLDLVKQTGDLIDAHFWLDRPEAFQIREPLSEIRAAASSALAEFDKVVHLRRKAAAELSRVTAKVTETLRGVQRDRFEEIGRFVQRLTELRSLRGELISLKEVRYIDVAVLDKQEQEVRAAGDQLAQKTVVFLLKPEALLPFRQRGEALRDAVPGLAKATDARQHEEHLNAAAADLDLLVQTVTNLKIQDATESTRIVENISSLYVVLNQARAALKQRLRALRGTEAAAEFASQMRMLDQGLANYLDLCGTPEKCDEHLNRLLVQVEELEARFSDFDEYVVQLAEKRGALASAFEGRKVELVEARSRRANALLTAAERILKGIAGRAGQLAGLDEINAYFASDHMVEKVRDLVRQLLEMGDTVKAEDLQTRLKTIHEEAVRQFKDRQELFAGGKDVIQLGRHQFRVNTQELALTVVQRGENLCLHATGTGFFEPIEDQELRSTQSVWNLETGAETPEVYRGEHLAGHVFEEFEREGGLEVAGQLSPADLEEKVRVFMLPRFREGYVKGVHDYDASLILRALLELHARLGLLRYSPRSRALAGVFWDLFPEGDNKALLLGKVQGHGTIEKHFEHHNAAEACQPELERLIADFATRTRLFDAEWVPDAAEYLARQLAQGGRTVVSAQAMELCADFGRHMQTQRFTDAFRAARQAVERDPVTLYTLLRDWLRGYVGVTASAPQVGFIDEAAWLLLRGSRVPGETIDASAVHELEGLRGTHPRVQQGRLRLDYHDFVRRLRHHEAVVSPQYERCQLLKKKAVDAAAERLRLDELKPRVLTTFVRNRLIDTVYLPLVGDNLAKQLGAAGEAKRTDRMGMLLLVSPPGYGKTTLVEYLANRLGLVFVKINGPAIGHRVTSLDPAEATNSAAREELARLNLAFELGDNLMVCLDDIQHLNPEFLQKFISLCDAQRRIEGVYQGKPRAYDLRGRKVAIVMAGNPYTESGERFRIPDMLANRADTYNLGDVIGGHEQVFQLSYLENAAGSNPTLARLAGRHPKDLHALIQLAAQGTREGVEFEAQYSAEELSEFVGVMRKLMRIRDVVLRVNEAYIHSAAQADAYRTEPPFKLQGSYRNMNRLAEKVSPVMNDAEIEGLLQSHYRNEAQTLTQGAEASLLKFRELSGALTPAEAGRWEEIKKTFRKNLLFRAGDEQDPVGQVVRQLSAFHDGLDSIREVLSEAANRPAPPPAPFPPPPAPVTLIVAPPAPPLPLIPPASTAPAVSSPAPPISVSDGVREVRITPETLRRIWDLIELQVAAKDGPVSSESQMTVQMPGVMSAGEACAKNPPPKV